MRRQMSKPTIMNWNAFREACDSNQASIQTQEAWGNMLMETQDRYAQQVNRTAETPEVDVRLLILWEARPTITRRCKKQKYNIKLTLKIAAITVKNTKSKNTPHNWRNKTGNNQLAQKRTLVTAKTWHLVRALIDPTKTKSKNNKAIYLLIRPYQGPDSEFLDKEGTKCFGNTNLPSYTGTYQGD